MGTKTPISAPRIIVYAANLHLGCVCVRVCACGSRLLEEYLDSKRLLSPVSPLSDSPDTNKPPSKTKTSDNSHHAHVKVMQQSTIWFISTLFCVIIIPLRSAQDGGGLHKNAKTSPTTV